MFAFPPFISGATAFSADEVFCGVALVQPTHGHNSSTEANKVRSYNFRLALHPYTMHVFDKAAHRNSANAGIFRNAVMDEFKKLLDSTDTIANSQCSAQRQFRPVITGATWSVYKDSFLISSLEPWTEAKRLIASITGMMEEFNMLDGQIRTYDGEQIRARYDAMVKDYGVLVSLIKSELRKGRPSTFSKKNCLCFIKCNNS
jgi:hypothetical protein